MMKKFLSMILAAAMLLTLAACSSSNKTDGKDGSDSSQTTSDLQYVLDKGKLVVGVTDFAPMDSKNDKGEWVGFDADMAKAFAKSLGVEAEFVEIAFPSTKAETSATRADFLPLWKRALSMPQATR